MRVSPLDLFPRFSLLHYRPSLMRSSPMRRVLHSAAFRSLHIFCGCVLLCLMVLPLEGFASELTIVSLWEYEYFLEYSLLESALVGEELSLFHRTLEGTRFGALFALCEQGSGVSDVSFLSNIPFQDTTRKPLPRTTTATLSTTRATLALSTNADVATPESAIQESTDATPKLRINAANIPLLTEPFVDVARFADSLGVRRDALLGGQSGRGITGIPYNSSQGYSFQAIPDLSNSQSTSQTAPQGASQAKSVNPQTSRYLRTTPGAAGNLPNIRLNESLMGTSLRTGGQTYTLDEYLRGRREYLSGQVQDSILHHYEFRKPLQMELANILMQSANLSIPMPNNPLTTIFGKPEVRLNANIEANLRLGLGVSGGNTNSATATGPLQVFPLFTQSFQTNISAGIGDKFNISLDNNTQRQFEFDNLTNVSYTGEPDEIFRRIEIGNVTLNSPSTFISGSQALFGGRVDLQFGPVYLKLLAATKRGQRKTSTVKGGSVKQPIALRAYDYTDNNFFIDKRHREVWKLYAGIAPPVQGASSSIVGNNTGGTAPNLPATEFAAYMRVKELEVWESTPDQRVQEAADGVVVAEIDSLVGTNQVYPRSRYAGIADTVRVGEFERGRFVKLNADRFAFDANLGRLTILNLRRDRTYGIAYRLEGPPGDGQDIVYGTFSRNVSFSRSDTSRAGLSSAGDSLVRLQLVYRPNMQPGFSKIWKRQMQNIYSIGAQQVSVKETKIDILYLPQSGGPESPNLPVAGITDKLATVLYVDRANNSGAGPPDGVVDTHLDFIFNATRGELVFPSLEPFRDGILQYFRERNPDKIDSITKFTYPDVYDTTRDAAKMNAGRDRFLITGEVSGRAGNRIQIPNAFNLAPGSVKVRLNNRILEEYTDYRVEYYTGVVELTNPEATLPSANVEIEYEQNDVFAMQEKWMLGARLDLDTKPLLRSRNITADFGITMMNYSQAIVTERIRLGEEPMNNTMIGADGKITWNADWLTKALDWLPFYDTKAPSTITASGEAAWMLPIPNNLPSTVTSDGGKPAIYIDDFEGAQRSYALGRQPNQWRFASPPTSDNAGNFKGMSADSISKYRGSLKWFQYWIGRVPMVEIYPNKSIVQGLSNNQNDNVLELNFDPDERGIYNFNGDFLDRITYNTSDSLNRRDLWLPDTTGTAAYKRDSIATTAWMRNQGPKPTHTIFSLDTNNRQHIWGGFMRLLSPFNTNFDNDNIEYLEIVIRVNKREKYNTKMFVDIGQISEDVIPNGTLDTEDGILKGKEIPNGQITFEEAAEDVGFDGLNNALERTPGRSDTTTQTVVTTATILGVQSSIRYDTVQPAVRRKGYTQYRNPNPLIRNELDPSRDDYRFSPTLFAAPSQNLVESDFAWYNGYEGNTIADAGKFPDTEVLNSNNGQSLMRSDDFFRYEINVSDLTTDKNSQIVNKTRTDLTFGGNNVGDVGGDGAFITYRIPLRKNFIRVGNPLFTNIQYVRVWWKGGAFKAQLADWKFVGSQWIRYPAQIPIQYDQSIPVDSTTLVSRPQRAIDTTLQVGFVSIEDNSGAPEYYTLPPGVSRQIQRTNPDPNQRVQQNEQSLALVSTDLAPKQEHAAARFFRPFDVFFYKQLKIFFYGKADKIYLPDTSLKPVPKDTANTYRNRHLAFIRFGIDTLNYYEYNTVLHNGWQEVVLDLAKLTSLKGDAQFAKDLRERGIASMIADDRKGQFIIRGAPTLTRIQYVSVGLRNNGTRSDVIRLWANELRAVDPDVNRAEGYAVVGNISAKIADLGTVNASFNLQGPYFHRLEERFGNRNLRQAFTLTSQFGLDKFFPEAWAGTSLPVSYSYNYTLDSPRFLPQSDVVVESRSQSEAGRTVQGTTNIDSLRRAAYEKYLNEQAQTETIDQQFAMTGVRFNIPIPFFLFTDFTNQLIFNFAYNNRQERSPIVAYKYNFNWRFQVQYAKNFAQIPIRPFGWTDSIPALDFLKDWTLYFLPSTMTLNLESNRSRTSEQLRAFGTLELETNGQPKFDTLQYQWNWLERLYYTNITRQSDTVLRPHVNYINSPVVRNFDVSRQLQMSWKLADNGLLNPTLDYTVNTYSTLLGYETTTLKANTAENPSNLDSLVQRKDDDVFRSILASGLGMDVRHTQNFSLNFRPRFPAFMGGNRFLVPTARYSSAYAWEQVFIGTSTDERLTQLNRGARYDAALNLGLALRLKDLGNIIIPLPPLSPQQTGTPLQFLSPAEQPPPPAAPQDSVQKALETALRGIKTVLFDWEQCNFSLTQTSNAQNMGLLGSRFGATGFMSGIAGFLQPLLQRFFPNNQIFPGNPYTDYGPSMAYQLGLVKDPHGHIGFNNPFTGQPLVTQIEGERPANAAMTDLFKQASTLDFRLQRDLWAGATLEISSGARNEYNSTRTLVTQNSPLGTATNTIEFYKYDRTFLSIFPELPLLPKALDRVNQFYLEYSRGINQSDTTKRRSQELFALNNAFMDGLESFSQYDDPVRRLDSNDAVRAARKAFFLPALNWALRWNGLEQFAPLQGILRTGSLEHKYVGRYASTERATAGGGRILDMQTVSVSFEPLIGITAQFDDKFAEGVASGSVRYGTKTQYGIMASNPTTITQETTVDISLQGTYTRRGFTLPPMGILNLFKVVGTEINIQNDIEFAFQFSYRRQFRNAIDIGRSETINPNGRRIDGTEKWLVEPSARYTFSKQVTVRAFLSFDGTFSEGASTPGTFTVQGGLDIRLNLTGGRNF